jgi:hypothetical protein
MTEPLRKTNKYIIRLNGQAIADTEWPPLAQAAWNRASRDRDSAQHGGNAELRKDGTLLARVQPETGRGHAWPDAETPECDLRDVLKALLQLLRDDEWTTKEIAEAMTAFGLPTTRGRVDALRGSTQGKRTEVTAAELVVMIYSVLAAYKARDPE